MANDLAGPLRWLADKLKLYPIKQLAVAASVWLGVKAALDYAANASGYRPKIDELGHGWGITVTSVGFSLLFGLISTRMTVKLVRNRQRKARERLRERSKAIRLEAKNDLYRRRADSLGRLSPDAIEVLRSCVKRRRSTFDFAEYSNVSSQVGREIADCGWATYQSRIGGPGWVRINDDPFNFLLEHPETVGSAAAPISTARNLGFDP